MYQTQSMQISQTFDHIQRNTDPNQRVLAGHSKKKELPDRKVEFIFQRDMQVSSEPFHNQ